MSDKRLIGKKRERDKSTNSTLKESQGSQGNNRKFLRMQKTINSLRNKIKNMNTRQIQHIKIIKKFKNKLKKKNQISKMYDTNTDILEEYEAYQISINPNNKENCKKWTNLKSKKIYTATEGNEILNLLDNIDDQTEPIQGMNAKGIKKNDYNFQFGQDIPKKKLFGDLKKIVNFINDNYPKNIKHSLKKFFNYKKIHESIAYISKNNGIISKIKKDILINFLLESDKSYLPEAISIMLCKTFSDVPLEEISIDEDKKVFQLDKEFLKAAVSKKIIKNIFVKVCKEYVNNYDENTINIQKILKDSINKMNIYFGELPENLCGITLFTGDVIINGKYLNPIYSTNKSIIAYRKQSLCAIFLVILHELCHILTRIVKNKCDRKAAKNAFIESEDIDSIKTNSFKFIKLKNLKCIFLYWKNKILDEFQIINEKYQKNIGSTQNTSNNKKKTTKINESGNFFDYNFFHSKKYTEITKNEANFFLDLKNYDLSETQYYNALKVLYNKRNNRSQGYLFKSNNLAAAFPIAKCGFALRRK